MSNVRNFAANLLLDIALSIVGLALLFWGIKYIRDTLNYRAWLLNQPLPDPVDTEIWAVLAEARRITEEAAGGFNATE